jgi:hypothetical protein
MGWGQAAHGQHPKEPDRSFSLLSFTHKQGLILLHWYTLFGSLYLGRCSLYVDIYACPGEEEAQEGRGQSLRLREARALSTGSQIQSYVYSHYTLPAQAAEWGAGRSAYGS